MDLIIGIILLVAAVFLVVSILFQSSKSHKMPGVISGGAETFFGKTKGKTIDRVLGKLTAAVAIIFCVLVIVMFVAQDQDVNNGTPDTTDTTAAVTDSAEPTDTTEATGESTDTTDEGTDTTAEGTDTSAEADDTAAEGEDTDVSGVNTEAPETDDTSAESDAE